MPNIVDGDSTKVDDKDGKPLRAMYSYVARIRNLGTR